MTKALLKKQMMEIFSWVYKDAKSGENRSVKGIFLNLLLYVVIFGSIGMIFYTCAQSLCTPLVSAGFGWLYMALMGLMSIMLGVFGSVFNTFSSLYKAKDNDLLLSMPIKVSKILLVRLSGVYAMGLLYELIVMIPALIVFYMNASLNLLIVVYSILATIALSGIVLVLSCIVGWVIAIISSRLKKKNIVTVVISLVFIAAYFYLYGNVYTILQNVLINPNEFGEHVKTMVYPVYHMGLAATEGNTVSMMIFACITIVLAAVTYLVLKFNFLKIVITNRGVAKTKYIEKTMKQSSADMRLLKKELRRFFGSPDYMLNCGLGIIFNVVIAVVVIVKADMITDVVGQIFKGNESIISLIILAGVCSLVSMCDITAPSVSLEGKNIWQLQVLPVLPKQVLAAKIRLQLVLTLIPLYVLIISIGIVLSLPLIELLSILVIATLYSLFSAQFGLMLNLKMPNLTWTSEIVPIKQGMPAVISVFSGIIVVLIFGGFYYLLCKYISPIVFMIIVAIVLMVLSIFLLRWINTKGCEIFSRL